MKSWVWKGMLAAAIALPALNGTAWAGGSDDHFVCSNATLKGDYAFSVLTIASALGENVVVGLGTFDGKTATDGTGGFKQIDYPGDGILMGLDNNFRTGQTGSYIVNPNCTGFMTINLGTSVGSVENAIVISNGGRSIHGVVAGFTLGGVATSTLTRVDFWKVASEQDN
jgi:hypothetical protein